VANQAKDSAVRIAATIEQRLTAEQTVAPP
jgi:hypothetical protein